MFSRHALSLVLFVVVITSMLAAAYSVDALRWRVTVLVEKFSGEIPELPLRDLIFWLRPKSPVALERLAKNPNPNAVIVNLDESQLAAELGKHLYSEHCAHCHGASGEGFTAPNLIAALGSGLSDWSFFSTVRWGSTGTAMQAQAVDEQDIWRIHTYLQSLALKASSANATPDAPKKSQVAKVPFETIRNADRNPAEWLTYGGNYAGQRHSTLTAITKKNVSHLQIEWVEQLRSGTPSLEASPIVHGGRIYISETPDGLVSIDASNGNLIWRYRRPLPGSVSLCCGSVNRGVAILDDAIFLQTLDAHLVAIDATTGQKRWEAAVADAREGYSMTGTPLALGDKVVVGMAGGEIGVRGFVSAFRPSDGQKLWTFHTVPEPGEAGHESWGGESWKKGGASTWATGTYDADSGTIFWGVGNPAPVYRTENRAGDNLFSNSLIALDEKTGSRRWHYQFTPADDHDWDAAQQPVLAEIPWEGKSRAVVLMANRNGFFYVLDRATGAFLLAKPFVKQTWNEGFDPAGRPMMRKDAHPTRTGRIVWPNVGGGTSWWPPSFDARRLLLFVSTVDGASIYFKSDGEGNRNDPIVGSTTQPAGNTPISVAIKAIDVRTGDIRWESILAQGANSIFEAIGGVLSTSSGLVFVGYQDDFIVLDADTGKVIRRIHLGGKITAPPVSYEVDGRQFVAVVAGKSLYALAIPRPN
jgi:alcohol dehydrogenase (cytochrome c)